MGGRGSSSSTRTGTGGKVDVLSADSLISARERRGAEVDATLSVLRDIRESYGVDIEDAQVVRIKQAGVMAYYDSEGNLAVNNTYFDMQKMNSAYDNSVASGFHPSRGNKSGMEATVAHEMGHRLTDIAGQNMGWGKWNLELASTKILTEARKNLRASSIASMQGNISGYAKQNGPEAIAEAFSDVYCNGRKAKRESTAIVNVLKKYL